MPHRISTPVRHETIDGSSSRSRAWPSLDGMVSSPFISERLPHHISDRLRRLAPDCWCSLRTANQLGRTAQQEVLKAWRHGGEGGTAVQRRAASLPLTARSRRATHLRSFVGHASHGVGRCIEQISYPLVFCDKFLQMPMPI